MARVTGPRVVGAQARALQRLRISFDRPVMQRSPVGVGDALNPASYALQRTTAPAVQASVTGVDAVTESSVDLRTDQPLTPGAGYLVSVLDVADPSGNQSSSPDNVVVIVGFRPSAPARRQFRMVDLLPAMNVREDDTGDLQRFLGCLQEVLDLVLSNLDRFSELLDPDLAPESVLDLMLAELGDPFAFDLTVQDKRRLIRILTAMYAQKGTAVGCINAIRFFLGVEVMIVPYASETMYLSDALLGVDWVLGPGTSFGHYAFDVVSPRVLTPAERTRIRTLVDYLKPAHTHFVNLLEPTPPELVDHVELGRSELDTTWLLHGQDIQ